MIDYETLIKHLRQDAFIVALTRKNVAQDLRIAADAIEELLKNQKEEDKT